MSTELATIPTSTYLALDPDSDVQEALTANLGEGEQIGESNLTRVTTPAGGSTMWIVPTVAGDEAVKELVGIPVYVGVRGVLWETDEPQEGTLPALVSHDLKIARLVNQECSAAFMGSIAVALRPDGDYDWERLPQTQWDSGRGGVGKKAKEQRVIYLLREQEMLPLVIAVQPGSLKNWKEFFLSLTKAGIPYYRAVVSLELEKATSANGQPFSRIVPRLVGRLSREEGARVKELFVEQMKQLATA